MICTGSPRTFNHTKWLPKGQQLVLHGAAPTPNWLFPLWQAGKAATQHS